MTETVTRLRAAAADEDRYGNAATGTPARLDIRDCLVAPRVEVEDATGGRQGRVIGWEVYAPHGADVLATDQVEVRGTTYDVDGEPEDWSGGYDDWQPGIVIKLRGARG